MKCRKVMFFLEPQDGFVPDQSESVQEKNREGFFHCWAPTIVRNPVIGQDVPGMVAIIEDLADSKLYELTVGSFDFVHPVEYIETEEL